jgi:hypothetical protein
MNMQFGITNELTNTQFAPVAALIAYFETAKVFAPLQSVPSASPKGKFSTANKLEQIILSILTGCKHISMVNTKLRPERNLAQVKRIDCFAEQSTLSIALNELTQMNLEQLEASVRQISNRCGRTCQHDWRGFLLLDFDLSGLPCGKLAEGSRKGHFSGKKTLLGGNWLGSAPFITTKPCGLIYSQATTLPCNVYSLPFAACKVHLT